MFFDSHTHLNDRAFIEDQNEVIHRAQKECQVSYMVNVGFNRETIPPTIQLAQNHDAIYAAVGWHPVDAHQCTEEDLAWIYSLAAKHEKVVAIGEMGLDYHWNYATPEQQKNIFRKQIRIAKELHLPIIIHDRDAHEDVVRILQEEKAQEVGGVMHCFGGDESIMQACLDMNFYIGLGGPVTFTNAKLPKKIASIVPEDRLLLETDSPYLAPHPYRGKRNESGYVRIIGEAIAELRGIAIDQLAEITTQNAKRLFGIM